MKLQSNQFNPHILNSPSHILVYGSETYLREKFYIELKTRVLTYFEEPPEIFFIESTHFNWQQLLGIGLNRSLFSEKRLIILRITITIDKKIAEHLLSLLEKAADCYFLITCDTLTVNQEKAAWVNHLIKHGLVVQATPLPSYKLNQWIKQQLANHNLETSPEGIALLAEYNQGNLITLSHQINLLSLLFEPGVISIEKMRSCLNNHSQYTLFQCIDSVIAMDTPTLPNIINKLQEANTPPALILTSIVRELRQLAKIKHDQLAGDSIEQLFGKHNVWRTKQPAYQKQLTYRTLNELYELLQHAKQLDAAIKGIDGNKEIDPWLLIKNFLKKVAHKV